MPIDPRIALQTQGIQVPDIGNAYERFMSNRARRDAMEQNKQLHQAQMNEIQERTQGRKAEAATAAKVGEVLSQGGGAKDVMPLNPDLGIKLAGEERAAQKATADATMAKYSEELKALEIRETKLKQLSSIAGSITDDNSLAVGISQAIRLGLPEDVAVRMLKNGYTPETAEQLKQFQSQGLSAEQQLTQERQRLELEMKQAEETRKAEAFPLEQEKRQNEAITGKPDAGGLTPAQRATNALELSRAEEAKRHNRVSEGQASQRLAAETAPVDVSEAGVDMMAKAFASTGTMPAVGMGKSAADLRKKIIERAATLYPDLDIGSAKADFMANNKSLRELTALNDRVVAFENTASKNIDVFLDSAKGIVDAGSPILNRPLRAAATALGNEKMAAFEAARETALTEISKVLESPGGGAALTVSGREAVKNLSSDSATLGQQIAAMKVLKRDMENRKEENRKQIEAIRNRIKLPSSSTGGDADLKNLSTDELLKRLNQ